MSGWKELFKLGLKEYQARCLACLIKNGKLTAQEISEKAKVPYSKIYSILKGLEDMNLLVSTNGRPKRYIAKPEEEVIEFFVEKKRKEYERIREQGRKAKQKLKTEKAINLNDSVYIQKTLNKGKL